MIGPVAGGVPLLAALYRSTIEEPPTGATKAPTAGWLLVPSTTQFTPRSAELSAATSTMIACTSTCARRMSSLSMTALIARIVRCGAVMISELVSLSAQIVPVPPARDTAAAVAALVGGGRRARHRRRRSRPRRRRCCS